MSKNCPPAPKNKKKYIRKVGKTLVRDFGKKKYYKPEEVKTASKKTKSKNSLREYVDWECWAMSIFCSHEDFDLFHLGSEEACDYSAMKMEMLAGLGTVSEDGDWLSIPSLDLDASWLDLGKTFGSILGGIGEFIGDIFS